MTIRTLIFGFIGAWLGVGLVILVYPDVVLMQTCIGVCAFLVVLLLTIDVTIQTLKGESDELSEK